MKVSNVHVYDYVDMVEADSAAILFAPSSTHKDAVPLPPGASPPPHACAPTDICVNYVRKTLLEDTDIEVPEWFAPSA